MKLLCALLLAAILLVLCWPLALAVFLLWPIIWLLSIPFRVLGAVVDGLIAFLRGIVLLPGRLLGVRATDYRDATAVR